MAPLATLLNWFAPLLHPLGEFRMQVAKLTQIHQSSVQTFSGLAGSLIDAPAGSKAFTGDLASSFWEDVQTYLNAENTLTGGNTTVVGLTGGGIVDEATVTCEDCVTEITGVAETAAAEIAGDAALDEVTAIVDAAAVAEVGVNPIADVAAIILTLIAGAALLVSLTKLAWDIYNAVQQWQRSMYRIGDTPLPQLPPNPTPAAAPTPSTGPMNQALTPQQEQQVNDILTQLSKEGVNGISQSDI